MSTGNADIVIRMRADMEKVLRDMSTLDNRVKATGRAASDSAKHYEKLERSFSRLSGAVKGYMSVSALMNLAKRADDFQVLENRVGRLGGSFQKLFNIAQNTNVPLATAVGLYEKIAGTMDTMGTSVQNVEDVTQAILQLGRIGSSTSEEIHSTAVQLGQAFSAPKAQMQEFAIILDSTPRLVKELLKELDGAPKSIKQAIENGLTMNEVMAGMLKLTERVNTEYKDIPANMRGAGDSLGNAWDALITKIDKAFGITKAIIAAMQELTGLVPSVSVDTSPAGIAPVIAKRKAEVEKQISELMELRAQPAISQKMAEGFDRQINDLKQLLSTLGDAEKAAKEWIEKKEEVAQKASFVSEETYDGKKKKKDKTAIQAVLDAEKSAGLPTGTLMGIWGQESNFSTNARIRNAQSGAETPFQIMPKTGRGLGIDVTTATFEEAAKASAEYMKQLLEAFDNDLENAYKAYNAGPGRMRNALAGKGAPLAKETIDYGPGAMKFRSDFLIESGLPDEIDTEKQKEAIKAAAEETKFLAEAQEDAATAVADLNKETYEQSEAWRDSAEPAREFIRQLDDLNAALNRPAGDPAKISKEVFDANVDLLAKQFDSTLNKTEKTTNEMTEFAVQAAHNIQDAFAEFLFEPWNKSVGEMLQSFVTMLHKMAAEILAQQLITGILGGLSGGSGGSAGFFGGVMKAFQHHDGGIVGSSGTPRTAPAYLWNFAPRMHSGGLAGDEVPAILQRGEQVLSRAAVAAGVGQGGNVRIVNSLDPELARDWSESSAGERVILNHIRRNPSAVRQYLGL
jgi:tape measure domain-containing protein